MLDVLKSRVNLLETDVILKLYSAGNIEIV